MNHPLKVTPPAANDELTVPRRGPMYGRRFDGGGGSGDDPPMTDAVPRSELDAKLDALRQEMRADSAVLRADFASFGSDLKQTVAALSVSVADLKGGLGEVRGSIDGLKSSITTLQWVIGLVVALGGIWVAYVQLKQSETAGAPVAAAPPIIINMPAASPAAVPVPAPRASGQ